MQINKPNLHQVDRICGQNIEFRKRLLQVLKRELPVETASYQENLIAGNFIECSENVHKLRHKIGMLGLDDAYYFSLEYEDELKNFDSRNREAFGIILNEMLSFIRQF